MEAKLTLEYDRTGDILYVSRTVLYAEQETEELDYRVVARRNPMSGDVESLEVMFFMARVSGGKPLELPVLAEFRVRQRV